MTRRLWFLFALLAALTFCQSAEAQPVPTWKNDAQGRPAPPCFTLDPVTGISTPCPPPAGGGSTPASGTTIITEGGQSTAFGNTWFTGGPLEASPNIGPGCVFLSDTQVACAGQQAGSVTGIRVYQSTDGGVTLPLTFTTNSTPGNLNVTGQLVRTTAGPYYMGLTANGAFGNNPLRTVDLNVWTATSGITAAFPMDGTSRMAVGGPAGNTVLAFTTTTTRICRVVSPASGFTCVTPAAWGGPDGSNAIAYVTGNTWVAIDAGGEIFRSTDDGVTWTAGVTLTGTKSGIGAANVVCPTATVCVANVGDSLFRSTDAGITWGAPVATGTTNLNALLNFGGGNIMALGSNLNTITPQPGCLPNCQNNANEAIRTIDNGVTWVAASGPWLTIAGTGGNTHTAIARSNGSAIVTHNRTENGPTNAGRNYGYTTTLPSGLKVLSRGEIPVIPIQGGTLSNSQTTGAVTTPVTVTLVGIAGFRYHLWSVSARCGAGADTATITVAEGATTRYSSAFTQGALVTENAFDKTWPTGLTIADGANLVVTLGACTAGAGTLIIQADQF
jgi:hypothetical protein